MLTLYTDYSVFLHAMARRVGHRLRGCRWCLTHARNTAKAAGFHAATAMKDSYSERNVSAARCGWLGAHSFKRWPYNCPETIARAPRELSDTAHRRISCFRVLLQKQQATVNSAPAHRQRNAGTTKSRRAARRHPTVAAGARDGVYLLVKDM